MSNLEEKEFPKDALVEFSMALRSVTHDKKAGTLRWKAVASDTDEDYYHDNMSLELFDDFTKRIAINELAPEEFRSTFWQGGMPYISVSHYPDLEGKAVPGPVERVFVDGVQLKADGQFDKTPLGFACYYAICKDLYEEPKADEPVRVSIAFLDYGHTHKSDNYKFVRESIDDICPKCLEEHLKGENYGKIFEKGQLVHLALTRVPANDRTSMEVEKSMTTRKEDAKSIVGEELAEEFEKEAKLVGKSQALVIKSDDETEEVEQEEVVEVEPVAELVEEAKKMDKKDEDAEDEEEDCSDKKKKPMKSQTDERLDKIETMLSQIMEQKPVEAVLDTIKEHELDTVFSEFKSAYDEIKALDTTPEDKLQQLQEYFNMVGQEVKSRMYEDEPEPEVEQTQTAQNDLVQALSQVMSPIANKLDLILTQQQDMVKSTVDVATPVRRSITPTLSMQQDIHRARKPAPKKESVTPKLRAQIERGLGLNQ